MSDENALLNAIAAHPDEDTPRLMYADWLQEHGRPIRAEFIRVQIEIARVEELPRIELNHHVGLFQRNQELIDNHRAELLGPLVTVLEVEFHRGFASEVALDPGEFGYVRHDLAAARPLPRVVVVGAVDPVRHFLGFDTSRPEPDWRTEIVSAIKTRSDDMNDDDEWGTYEPSLYRFAWDRLDELDASGCQLGGASFTALLTHSSFPVLSDLDLSANNLTDAAIDSLLSTQLPRQLKRLILGGNVITDAGAVALAERWPTGDGDRLEHLNLRFTNIGQPGQAALLRRFGGRVDLF